MPHRAMRNERDDAEIPEAPENALTDAPGPFTLKFLYAFDLKCPKNGAEAGEIRINLYQFDKYPAPSRFFYSLPESDTSSQKFCGPFHTVEAAAAAVSEEWLAEQLKLRYAEFLRAEERAE